MLKKTINYVDYDGNARQEDFYFNLSKAELAEMELSTEGGLETVLNNIINARDIPKITAMFKKLILSSYGQKSLDGKRFVKDKTLTEEFTQTEAYSELFMDLISDEQHAVEFVRGILPVDIQQQINQENLKSIASKE